MSKCRLNSSKFICSIILSISCANANALGLQQAYDLALKNDATYRISLYARVSAKENLIIGRSTLMPTVSANYESNRNIATITTTAGANRTPDHPRYDGRTMQIQVRQPLLSLDGVLRYQQGKIAVEKGDADFATSTYDVTLRVAGAYMDVLYAEDQVALSRVSREMYLEQMQVNKRLFENGEGTKTDMLETQARLDLAEVQLIEANDNVTYTRENLTAIIGIEPGQLDTLNSPHILNKINSLNLESWEQLAQRNNPELIAGRLAVESARLEISRIRAGHYPRVDLVASYNKGDSETLNTYTQNSVNRTIGVQINIPIYQGGVINANTRQAVAAYSRAESELDVRTNKVLGDLRKAWSQIQSGGRKIDALSKAVNSGKISMAATEKSIAGGARINLDLLNAQQRLYSSQLDHARASYDYVLSMLKIRAAAGTLDYQAIIEVSANFRNTEI